MVVCGVLLNCPGITRRTGTRQAEPETPDGVLPADVFGRNDRRLLQRYPGAASFYRGLRISDRDPACVLPPPGGAGAWLERGIRDEAGSAERSMGGRAGGQALRELPRQADAHRLGH